MDIEKVTIMVSFMALCFSAVGIMLALANAGISQREGRIRLIAEKLMENGFDSVEEQRAFCNLMLGKKAEIAELSSPHAGNMMHLIKNLQRQMSMITMSFLITLIAVAIALVDLLIKHFDVF